MDIFSIFNLFALLYIFRGAQIVLQVWRQWASLKQEPLTRVKKQLTNQAAFFIAVPPSVLVHELFHALAIWYFGGRVVDFGFTFFGGYVVPDRLFIPQQQWIISIAGTIGSLVFGVAIWLATRRLASSSFRYFGLRAFRVQLIVALVFYPLLALGGFGDWATIYNFSATPILSSVTAVLHIGILVAFYRADRHGWFEMAGFETVAEQEQFADLQRQAGLNPQDHQITMQVIDGYRRGGATQKATTQLKQYLRQNPDDANGFALLAILQASQKNHIPSSSKENAEKALSLSGAAAGTQAAAHLLLGEYALERQNLAEAVAQFSDGLAVAAADSVSGQMRADLTYRRGQAYRRQNDFVLAREDGEQALALAAATGDKSRVKLAQEELLIIENHAGRLRGEAANAPTREDVV